MYAAAAAMGLVYYHTPSVVVPLLGLVGVQAVYVIVWLGPEWGSFWCFQASSLMIVALLEQSIIARWPRFGALSTGQGPRFGSVSSCGGATPHRRRDIAVDPTSDADGSELASLTRVEPNESEDTCTTRARTGESSVV